MKSKKLRALLSRKKSLLLLIILTFPIFLLAIFYIHRIVQNNAQNTEIAAWITACNASQGQEFQCWVDGIESMIQHRGVNAAFAIISGRLLDEPRFKRSCIGILHDVGHWTYHNTVHNKNKGFIMPPNITVCSNAFVSAFAHALTSTTGDFVKAVEFCTNPQLDSEWPRGTANCYHGIGHGASGFYFSRLTGKERQSVVARALEECAEISHTPPQLNYCTGGVFSEVIEFYKTNQYGLSLNKKDPFAFCREQDVDSYKRSCYATAKPLLLWLTNGDFSKAASFIEHIAEDTYATVAIDALASSVAAQNIRNGTNVADYVPSIIACRNLQERLHLPCVKSLAMELLTYSSAVDAANFCQLSMLLEQEQAACFTYVASNFVERTPRDKLQQVCSSLGEKYKEFCHY